MIWRAVVFFSAFFLCTFVGREYGSLEASVTSSAIAVIVIPLSEIERRLSELIKVMKA